MQRRLMPGGLALALTWSMGCGDVEINAPHSPRWQPEDPPNAVHVTSEWRGAVAPGHHIEIKGVYGDIRAVRTAGSEVVVSATRIGEPDAVADVRIDVVPHADGVTVCAVYPDVPGQAPNSCQPGDAGTMSVRDEGRGTVRVAFLAQVPDGVHVVAKTVTGNVEATGLRGDVLVRGVLGDVEVSTTRLATARTVTGSITATIGLANWDRDLDFSTAAGDVDVTIPGTANVDVWAAAPSGRISTQFPLSPVTSGGMRGTIGAGGPLLRLTTLSGDITLRRGP